MKDAKILTERDMNRLGRVAEALVSAAGVLRDLAGGGQPTLTAAPVVRRRKRRASKATGLSSTSGAAKRRKRAEKAAKTGGKSYPVGDALQAAGFTEEQIAEAGMAVEEAAAASS